MGWGWTRLRLHFRLLISTAWLLPSKKQRLMKKTLKFRWEEQSRWHTPADKNKPGCLQDSSPGSRPSYLHVEQSGPLKEFPKARHLVYDVLSGDTFALFSFLSAITLIAFTYDFFRQGKPLVWFLSQSAVRQASHLAFWSFGVMTSLWLAVSKETKRKDFDSRTDAAFKRDY